MEAVIPVLHPRIANLVVFHRLILKSDIGTLINGRHFTPKLAPMAFSSSYSMRHNGMQTNAVATQITLQVEFHPEYLGAKKGDQVGVQLLLCPRGSEYSGPEQDMQMPNAMDWNPTGTNDLAAFSRTGRSVRMIVF